MSDARLTLVGGSLEEDGRAVVMVEVSCRAHRWSFDATLVRHRGTVVVAAIDRLQPVGALPEGGIPGEVVRAIRPGAIVKAVLTNAPIGVRVMEPDESGGPEVLGPDFGSLFAEIARLGLGLPPHNDDDPVPPARRAADRRRYNDIDLARHAVEMWRTWRRVPRSPNKALAEELGVTPESVRDQTKRAADQGFWAGQGHGKAGGTPTPRAVEVLKAAGELAADEATELLAAHEMVRPTEEP